MVKRRTKRAYRSNRVQTSHITYSNGKRIRWPIYVSTGIMDRNGILRVVVLRDREDADRRGYQWVGR
jgi:hypothetical protein